MDMNFANQALCAEYMAKNYKKPEKKVCSVPEKIESETSRVKLKSIGIAIDVLTPAQKKCYASWQEGT